MDGLVVCKLKDYFYVEKMKDGLTVIERTIFYILLNKSLYFLTVCG